MSEKRVARGGSMEGGWQKIQEQKFCFGEEVGSKLDEGKGLEGEQKHSERRISKR